MGGLLKALSRPKGPESDVAYSKGACRNLRYFAAVQCDASEQGQVLPLFRSLWGLDGMTQWWGVSVRRDILRQIGFILSELC